MSDALGVSGAPARVLEPLWWTATGVAVAAAAAANATWTGPSWCRSLLIMLGIAAWITALLRRARSANPEHDNGLSDAIGSAQPRSRRSQRLLRMAWLVWLASGLALGAGRGLECRQERLDLSERLAAVESLNLRARMVVLEGWSRSRWGRRARVRVLGAEHRSQELELPAVCFLEVRGTSMPSGLPQPGSLITALVRVRGSVGSRLLVASSASLLKQVEPPSGAAALRDSAATRLLEAAGTDVVRIRSAELAATLSLGRRDLLPQQQRRAWRASGLAHVLAVSGLHVGMVAAMAWALAMLLGLRPRQARLMLLVLIPTYAVMAGASPSCIRAALMAMIYLVGRLLGRELVAMGAVLLAATVMVLASPTLALDAGFQLTVLITAALVRWAGPLSARIPGPRWLAGALALPVIAQLAAAPIVAAHFHTAMPGAALANVAVPVLLAPALVLSLGATLLAGPAPAVAGWLLDLLHLITGLLWLSGGPARAASLIVPTLPGAAVLGLIASGWLALESRRRALVGVAAWMLVLGATLVWRLTVPAPSGDEVVALPVSDGTSVLLVRHRASMLLDGGRLREEAAEILASAGVRSLELVVATHGDEDHVGGLRRVLETVDVRRLVLPAWMLSRPAAVPLLRAARRRGTLIVPVSRGTSISLGREALQILWPPAGTSPRMIDDNEGSVAALLPHPSGAVLLLGDQGAGTEARLASLSSLRCGVLLAAHHGSRTSTSATLLDAARPRVVLIPAGPGNLHGHPHPTVLGRLDRRPLQYRSGVHDGLCGAYPYQGRWIPFP